MPQQPIIAAIALGANLGDRRSTIGSALLNIGSLPKCRLLKASDLFETDPVSPIPQPPFLNAAATVSTTLSARALLDELLDVEVILGRNRSSGERWGPRTIDLDLLLYGDQIIHEPGLTIPHPRMHERLFVLTPLASIAPDLVVPGRYATVSKLRDSLLAAGTRSSPAGSN